jgi:hemerythrin-like domain-containing protein
LLAAALVPHAEIENELLFDPMEAAMGGGSGPPAAMREEHEEIEEQLAEVGMETDPERARTILLDAIRLARIHFEKEERIAFPLAEDVLGNRALEEQGIEWANRRRVLIAGTVRAHSPGPL